MAFPRYPSLFLSCLLSVLLMSAARAADAVSLGPDVQRRLEVLKAGFEAFAQKTVEAPYAEGVQRLNDKARPALERESLAAAQRKDLDGLVRIKADLERMEKGGLLTITDAPPPDAIKGIYTSYRLEMERLTAARKLSLADAKQRYDKGLAQVQDELTSAQDVNAALRVKKMREDLAAVESVVPASAPAPAPAADAVAAGAPATKPALSAAASSKQAREVVEKLGGTFTQGSEGESVSLEKTQISTDDLLKIGAAKRMWKFIWRSGKGLQDEGMAAFAGMKNLEELWLWDSGSISDEGLKHLRDCEKLQVLNLGCDGDGITGSGLENLSQCKVLRKANLSYLPKLEGKNLRHLSELKSFEILLLGSCKGIVDADLDWVAKMKSLKTLDLGRTGVTDAGLMKLATLGKLEELIVSEPGVTPAGGKALAKELPGLEVKFVK
ncbi:MAG: hypothetical protein J0L73_14085 [Verrucomicrobia bacterium]|nr:hypothetical protein [Verrucomicrobiota bacterium]